MTTEDRSIGPAKDYAERGVQTEAEREEHLVLLSLALVHAESDDGENRARTLDNNTVAVVEAIESTAAYSSQLHLSKMDGVQDPTDQISTEPIGGTLHVLKQRSTKARHLPSDRTLKSVSARVVSLPETEPIYTTKTMVKRRVVSLPEQSDADITSYISSPRPESLVSEILDTEGSVHLHRSRVRVESRGTDFSRTPSPPSSPESIVIIAHNQQLSEGFLQKNPSREEISYDHADDNGWITWAKSPPRPIPALHGPLSLPYARCPSGAEGTIIEEQDNLPRMIWGLENDDGRPGRSQADAISNHSTPRKSAPRPTPAAIPPRFAKAREQVNPRPLPLVPSPSHKPNTLPVPVDTQAKIPRHQLIYEQAQLERAFSGHGPIDLSTVLRPRAELPYSYHSYPNLQDDIAYDTSDHNISGYNGNSDIGSDWRSSQLQQELSAKTGLQFAGGTAKEVPEQLKPSLSTSSSLASLSSLASSRSISTIDSPNADHRMNSPLRMSALEIAQKYRQQQLQQQGQQQHRHMLPTPPSSSSPIWSSRVSPQQGSFVSPYSDSFYSPELAMASSIPAIMSYLNQANLQQLQRQTENPLTLSATIEEEARRAGLSGQKSAGGPMLAPESTQFQVRNTHNLRASLYSPDMIQLDQISKFLQAQNRANPLGLSPVSNVHHSPSLPRPPPNTPAAALSHVHAVDTENPDRPSFGLSPVITAPLSPASPDLQPRPRSISHQHPRSIPLTQLIQRRLSSVPEEDVGALLDYGRTPSPMASPLQRSRSYSSGETPISARKRNTPISNRQSHPAMTVPPVTVQSQGPPQAQAYRQRAARSTTTSANVPQKSAQQSGPRAKGKDHHSRNAAEGRESPAQSMGNNRDPPSREGRGGGGRGRGRGKRGRGAFTPVRGPERVDGGMTVRG